MTLFSATLLAALISLALGLALLIFVTKIQGPCQRFLRSTNAAYITMGLAGAWFLFLVARLGPADFGEYKNYLFVFFLGVCVLSFHFVPDFLSVRGLCGLILLAATHFLDAAFLQAPPSRLLMVGFIFAWIIAAIFLSAYPYRLRDFFTWLFAQRKRSQSFGIAFIAYALALLGVAFSYGNY